MGFCILRSFPGSNIHESSFVHHTLPGFPLALFHTFAVQTVSPEIQRVDTPTADTQGLGSGALNTREEAPPRAWNEVCSWLCLTWETATLFQFVLTKHTNNFLLYSQNTLAFFPGVLCQRGFPDNGTRICILVLSCTKSILKQEAGGVASGSRPASEFNEPSASGVQILLKLCCVLRAEFSSSIVYGSKPFFPTKTHLIVPEGGIFMSLFHS